MYGNMYLAKTTFQNILEYSSFNYPYKLPKADEQNLPRINRLKNKLSRPCRVNSFLGKYQTIYSRNVAPGGRSPYGVLHIRLCGIFLRNVSLRTFFWAQNFFGDQHFLGPKFCFGPKMFLLDQIFLLYIRISLN